MTPQLTLLGEWEPFSGIWPRWGSLRSGEVFELPTWAPAMGGRELSSWAGENWPTPDAQAMNDGADPKLHAARQERMAAKHNNGNGAGTPLAVSASIWRTPDAPKAGGARTHTTSQDGGHQFTIADQAERWLTPRTPNGGKKLDEATTRRKGMDANGIKRTVDLSNQAEYWPTIAARDYRDPNLNANGRDQLPNFAAQTWRTPLPPSSLPAHPMLAGLTFYERVRILLRLCRSLKSRLRSPYNKAHRMFKGRLNPSFCDWLMGLPPGFTSEEFDFSVMEIWLSRSRRQLSLLCSPERPVSYE